MGVSSCTISELRAKRLFCCFNSWFSHRVGGQRAEAAAHSFLSAGNFVERGERAGFPQPLWFCRAGWMLLQQRSPLTSFFSQFLLPLLYIFECKSEYPFSLPYPLLRSVKLQAAVRVTTFVTTQNEKIPNNCSRTIPCL